MARLSTAKGWVSQRPAFAMAMSVILKVVVPAMATLAGNNDPHQNSIAHAFGSSSICVAMDFPGWLEAAGTMFFFSGLIDCWAVFVTCKYYNEEHGGESWSPLLKMFAAVTMTCLQALFLVAVWNPTKSHDGLTVFFHTLPYIMVRFGFMIFVLFLMVALKPSRAWNHFWKFYIISTLWNFSVVVAKLNNVWTLSIFLSSGAGTLEEQADIVHDMPFMKYPYLKFGEPASVVLLIMTLVVHPLGWVGTVEKPSRVTLQQIPEAKK